MRCMVFILWSQCRALGQALVLSQSRERGIVVDVVLLSVQPLPSGLRIKSAMTWVVAAFHHVIASSYSDDELLSVACSRPVD